MQPKIIVLSGPGGVGKNTIHDGLLAIDSRQLTSITKLTTRTRREGERDGEEFHFISIAEFETALSRDELLEHNFFNGNYYGVPKAPLETALAAGLCPVLVIDINGARAVRTSYPHQSFLVFITAPLTELKARYLARGQSAAEADARIQIAVETEIPAQTLYDVVIENSDGKVQEAIEQIAHLVHEAIGSQ